MAGGIYRTITVSKLKYAFDAKIGTTQQRPEYSIPGNGNLTKMAIKYASAAIAEKTDSLISL
jgi:hypothetical protein